MRKTVHTHITYISFKPLTGFEEILISMPEFLFEINDFLSTFDRVICKPASRP